MCRASSVGAAVEFARLPIHPGALELARDGFVTGASKRNFDGYGREVTLAAELGDVERALLTDPQTSGGLLVACAPEAEREVLAIFRREGFGDAAVIGRFDGSAPVVRVA